VLRCILLPAPFWIPGETGQEERAAFSLALLWIIVYVMGISDTKQEFSLL